MLRLSLLCLVATLLIACSSDDGNERTPAQPRITSVASPVVVNGTSVVPPSETPPAEQRSPSLRLSGLFREPRPVEIEVSQVSLPERPQSHFQAWDGESVVLYDTQTGRERNLGQGSVWSPPFGDNEFVFTSEGEVWLVDLESLERNSLGAGLVAYFMGNEHVVINPGDNNFTVVNTRTGRHSQFDDITSPLLRSMIDERWGGSYAARWIDDLYTVRNAENPEVACPDSLPDRRRCLVDESQHWVVENAWTGDLLLEFRANKVEPAGPREVVVATTPSCTTGALPVDCHDLLVQLEGSNPGSTPTQAVEGATNIFILDLETGEAEFIATASYNPTTASWPLNWPLAADSRYVVWTESYCSEPAGSTKIYDRETGELRELDGRHWVEINDGRLGIGEFGAKAILDPETLEYIEVLPELGNVSWTEDFRYAAASATIGGDPVCG